MKAIVFTKAAFAIALRQSGGWWLGLTTLSPNEMPAGLSMAENTDFICFWSLAHEVNPSFLIISCPNLFDDLSERAALTVVGRVAKLMRAGLDGGRIPPEFGPFRHGKKISAFAFNYGAGLERIVAVARPFSSGDFFVCGFGKDEGKDLANYEPDYDAYHSARDAASQLIPQTPQPPMARSVTLAAAYEKLGTSIGSHRTWQDWLRALNKDQVAFVKMPIDRPIRVRGSAGTGKTLILAIKAMTLLDEARRNHNPCRILFLTHSWALAEAADELMDQLDPGRDLRQEPRSMDVWPLLTLADSKVHLGATSRRLLGTDSRSGKIEILTRLQRHLEDYLHGDWVARRSGCTSEFVRRLEAESDSLDRKLLLLDVMNEFATVFAAAGIHPRKRQDYMRLRRARWMLRLLTDSEKEVLADLYELYFEGLEKDGLTGPEQLVSDYLKALSTFEWQRLRKTEGFDYVFVDEMHLFDEQERFVIHQLLNDGSVRPRVAMAIDPKQSPLDLFVSHTRSETSSDTSDVYKRANLPNPHKLELTTVFRNTPEIQALIQVLLDLMMHPEATDEWATPKGQASDRLIVGDAPIFQVHQDSTAEFKWCFESARKYAREGERAQVGIICMDAERFDTYLSAAAVQFKGDFIPIASQADLVNVQSYSRRFIVSMPEFVQGLQFDYVLVLDVNDDPTSEEVTSFHRKSFLTELYLASSRARIHLELHASKAEGGLTTLLNNAINSGALKERK